MNKIDLLYLTAVCVKQMFLLLIGNVNEASYRNIALCNITWENNISLNNHILS